MSSRQEGVNRQEEGLIDDLLCSVSFPSSTDDGGMLQEFSMCGVFLLLASSLNAPFCAKRRRRSRLHVKLKHR
jgi:hypothetical protein